MSETRTVHDWLLRNKPEGASHDEASCQVCISRASTEEDEVAEEKIFTQEQHEQLLQAAIDKAVAEATSKMDGEVLRLNDQVEALQKDIEDRDTKVAELEKAISDRDEATRLEKLANERADKVKEKASFTDEQIEARKEGWAAMTDEAFTAYLEDLETVAAASASSKTKFDGTREAATDDEASAVRKLLIGEGN